MADLSDNTRIYREMLKLDPSSKVFEALAEELCAAGEWAEVVRVCREGLKYHPDHIRPRVLLGLALMELGEQEESRQVLLEVYEEIQKSSLVFEILSEQAAVLGDSGQAARFARIYESFHALNIPGEGEEKAEEAAQPVEPPMPSLPPGKLELILSALADRLGSRLSPGPTRSILSTSDSEVLKKAVEASM